MSMIGRLARRLRYGAPIVVVSGLPRSGTSMMMRMLEAGGVTPLDDGLRAADDSNPKGYFEFEPVKELERARGDVAWLPGGARQGRQDHLVPAHVAARALQLPGHLHAARSRRSAGLAAADAVAARRCRCRCRCRAAETGPRSREVFASHLVQVERFMAARACFTTLYVPYREAVAAPEATAAAVARFLGRSMDTAAMARAVEASLYRNRA